VKVAIRERKFDVVPARCSSAYTCYTMSRTKTNRPLHEEEAKASFSMLSKRVSAFLNIISSKIIIPVDTYFVDDEGTMHRESCSQYIRILILYKTGKKDIPLAQEANGCNYDDFLLKCLPSQEPVLYLT